MRVFFASLLLTITSGAFAIATAPTVRIPSSASAYRTILVKEARNAWGLNANIALFAAQIHTESRFRANAESPVGAKGLTQFMPATAADMNRLHPNSLGQLELYSPLWSIRAMVLYDRTIWRGIDPFGDAGMDDCSHWAMTLAGYNGGPGWINRDRRLTKQAGDNPDAWFGHVSKHSTRASWAFKENRGYPDKTLNIYLPAYLNAGWTGEDVCSQD